MSTPIHKKAEQHRDREAKPTKLMQIICKRRFMKEIFMLHKLITERSLAAVNTHFVFDRSCLTREPCACCCSVLLCHLTTRVRVHSYTLVSLEIGENYRRNMTQSAQQTRLTDNAIFHLHSFDLGFASLYNTWLSKLLHVLSRVRLFDDEPCANMIT